VATRTETVFYLDLDNGAEINVLVPALLEMEVNFVVEWHKPHYIKVTVRTPLFGGVIRQLVDGVCGLRLTVPKEI